MFRGKSIDSLKESFKDVKQRVEQDEEKLDRLSSELQVCSKKIADLTRELGQSKAQAQRAPRWSPEKTPGDLGEETAVFDERTDTHHKDVKQEVAVLQEQVKTHTSQLENSLAEIETLRKEWDQFQSISRGRNEAEEELKSSLGKQEALIQEKEKRIRKLESELVDAREAVTKLQMQRDMLERDLEDTRQKKDAIEQEHALFKKKLTPGKILDSHLRVLVSRTDQGKILLELEKLHPTAQTIDLLSERIGIASVMIKTAVNALRDMGIVLFDQDTREVRLLLE